MRNKFYTALLKGNIIPLYDFVHIINEPIGPKSKHCLEISIEKDDIKLFIFLLKQGADPFLSADIILKNTNYLEYVLINIGGVSHLSPWFNLVNERISKLRGKKKSEYIKILKKYDYPEKYGNS